MNRSIGNVTKNLVMAAGLALVMVTILLWGADRWMHLAVAASPPPVQQTQRSTDPILPVWSVSQVFTTYYEGSETVAWTIAPCSVVITLPRRLVGTDQRPRSAIFTFTTESSQAFPMPLMSIERFFSLDGDYVIDAQNQDLGAIGPQDLSFNIGKFPTLEWRYQDSEIGPLSEPTLQLYREWGLFGDQDWKPQNGFVDTEKNKAVFSLEQLDLYGFGGYRVRYHLPIVLRSFPSDTNP